MRDIFWETEAGQQTDFEYEYIDRVVLKKIDHRNHFGRTSSIFVKKNPVIVYSCDEKTLSTTMLKQLSNLERYYLIHLSNENLQHDASYYRAACAVLRSYYDPNILWPQTFCLPLGFKTGFLNREKNNADNRKYAWCFAGQVKSHRANMIALLQTLTPNYVHLTNGWNSADGLTVSELTSLYRETVFIPCPFGFINPDSFRIMEALEYGCIPVCLKFYGADYFKFVYGDHPFLVASSWQDACEKMRYLLVNQDILRQKQELVIAWYDKFKNDLADDVKVILAEDGGKLPLKSKQFEYQTEGRRSLTMRSLYRLHFGCGISSRIFHRSVSRRAFYR
jgi:hypothetical protein